MTTWATGVALRVGQKGHIFRLRFVDEDGTLVDVSAATAIQLTFRSPAGVEATETAVNTTDGTDGNIQFDDIDGDYAASAGDWKYWGTATFGADVFISGTLSYPVEEVGEG